MSGQLLVSTGPAAVFSAVLPVRRATADLAGIDEVVVDLRDAQVVDHTFLAQLSDADDDGTPTTCRAATTNRSKGTTT